MTQLSKLLRIKFSTTLSIGTNPNSASNKNFTRDKQKRFFSLFLNSFLKLDFCKTLNSNPSSNHILNMMENFWKPKQTITLTNTQLLRHTSKLVEL